MKKKPRKGTEIVVESKVYASIKDAAVAYPKCPYRVRKRIASNWSIEEALDISPRPNYKAKIPIKVGDKTFKSVKAAAEEYGLNYKAVHFRLHNGYSIEEAFELCDRSRKGIEILVEGKLYPSCIAVCEAYKKDYRLVQSRTQNGWTIEEALDLIPRKFYENGEVGYIYLITNIVTQKEYVGATRSTPEDRFKGHVRYAYREDSILSINGLHYDIKKYGINKFELKVLDSAKNLGELRQLEEHYIQKRNSLAPVGYNLASRSCGLESIGITTVVKGIEYPSLCDAARAYGISHETVRGRLSDGWSYEEAFGIVERKNLNAVVLEGVEYASRLKAAEAYKIDVKLVEARLKIGWDNEEAFGIKKKPNASHSPVVVNDTCFPSLAAAAKEHKISLALARSRKRKGFTIEEALGIKEREIIHPLHIQLQVQGKTFFTVKEAADFYKLKPATLRNRLVNGYTVEEALGVVPKKRRASKKKSEKFSVNGQVFENLEEAANHYNIKKSVVQGRLKAKWLINEAFGLVPKMKKDSIEVQGILYASVTEAAKKYSVPSYLVKARLKLGWTLVEALQIVDRPEKKGIPVSVTINGRSFESKKDAADAYGIDYGTFKWRLQRGWSPEQAAGIEFRPERNGQNEITVNGKVFPSIRVASEEFGQKPATVARRIRDLGWTIEKALGIGADSKSNPA